MFEKKAVASSSSEMEAINERNKRRVKPSKKYGDEFTSQLPEPPTDDLDQIDAISDNSAVSLSSETNTTVDSETIIG